MRIIKLFLKLRFILKTFIRTIDLDMIHQDAMSVNVRRVLFRATGTDTNGAYTFKK